MQRYQFLNVCEWNVWHSLYDTTSHEATCMIIILLHEIIFCTSEIITATSTLANKVVKHA